MAQQAMCSPEMVCNNVLHVMDRAFVLEAYRQTHTSRAPGAEQRTAQPYAAHLAENLRELYER